MVGVHQDHGAAFAPGQLLGGLQQLPAHALALEFGQDVQRELRQVQVVRQRQGDVHGAHDLAVHLGHEDHLPFIRVLEFQELLQRRVGEVVAAPRLHPDLAAHFDGGKEVGGVRRVEGIRESRAARSARLLP